MPADTFSANLGLIQMGTGNDNNTWGINLNAALIRAEKGIAGFINHPVTGGTLDLSADPTLGSPVALEAIQNFTGVLGSNQIVVVPNASRIWLVDNQTTGAFTLTFKTPSGSASAAIPQGGQTFVWCNGSNVITLDIPTTYATVQFKGGNGVVGAPFYSFLSETTSGIYRKSAGVFAFAVGGVEIFDWDASGVNLITGQYRQAGAQLIPPGSEQHYAGIEVPAGWLFEAGQAISRATFAPLLGAITKTLTGNTHGNTTIDGLSEDPRFKGLLGAFIEGTGISIGTTITAVTATSFTVSATVSGSASVSLRVLPYGQGDGSTTFNVPDRRSFVVAGRSDMNGSLSGNVLTPTMDGTRLNSAGGETVHTLSVGEMPAHAHGVTDPTHTHSIQYTIGSPAMTTGGNSNVVNSLGTGPSAAVTNAAATGISIQNNGGGAAHNNVQITNISNMIIKT